MGKLDRYIGSSVLVAILAVLGIILGLASLFAFIDEVGNVTDTYTVTDVLSYVALTAPRRLYDMMPMAALIGCLIGLGSLASNSELTIMRAAGVSIARIVWAVMKPMLLLMATSVLIGEYVAPPAETTAQANRALAQGSGDAQSSKRGLWHRQGDEFIHINAVQPGGLLVGVTRYRFDEERHMLSSSFAKRAQFNDNQWVLSDVTTTHFRNPGKGTEASTEVINEPTQTWDIALKPELLNTVVMVPESLPISGLWSYIHYLKDQGL
ncbi:MAG: LPS export ABC transporter permease LptG, partial [Pseudomonas sp.]|nr:LPS export ABC transporter permease LptG [Pseudomonas sp.]